MASRILTHSFVKTIAREGRYGDGRGGRGLSLLVKRTANGRWSKTWSQRLRINGKLTSVGLGPFPIVTLAEAREKVLDNALRVAHGTDIRKPRPTTPTLAAAFEAVIAARAPSWKGAHTKRAWYLSLGYCEKISAMPLSEVTATHVLQVLAPLWQKKPKMGREVRSNLSTVMEWAILSGYRTTNPASSAVARSLGKQPPGSHHRSLKPTDLGSALAVVRDADAWWATRACLIFLALTGVRGGEATQAHWDEINLDTATWTIPALRMKASLEHVVPLSTQVLAVLAYARDRSDHSEHRIFPPDELRRGDHMRTERLSTLLRQLKTGAVPHGGRSSFRNWAGARGDISQPVAETVLAHTQPKKVEGAYLTEVFFEQRRTLMQEWADFLSETMGRVIPT